MLAVGIFKLQSNVKYFVYLKEIRITVEARGKVRLYVLKRTLEAYCKVGGLKGVGTPAIACETSLEVNNKSLVFRSVCSVIKYGFKGNNVPPGPARVRRSVTSIGVRL